MITARDMAAAAARPPRYSYAPAFTGTHGLQTPAAAVISLRERILLVVLFITVLASSIAFIEPSPHDALMGVLAVAAVIAGVRLHRTLVLLVFCLVIWNVSGLISLINALDIPKTIQYAATSIYLAIAAILFACLFAENTMPRITVMRTAYVITAACVALAGTAGYFNAFPGSDIFAPTGRALGAFKDPNVFGPFLIWPALFLMYRVVAERVRVLDLVPLGCLLLGLLLSFSRGAWFHFAVSAIVAVGLAFLTAPTQKARFRVFGLSIFSLGVLVALIVVLLSIPAVQAMFSERAHLINSYDVGQGGRFRLQEIALSSVLMFPDGMGPFGFATAQGLQQHNVYLQAFLVYGWAGAMAYILMLLTTVFIGFRTVFVRTPWQPYIITALAAFIGEMAEGFVIDSDHWRHFFLLLGMVWGLAAATFHQLRVKRAA